MDAAAAIGWYGPLIDLSSAPTHVDGFVQLLVFVHSSRPFQKYGSFKGRALSWIDTQVGDETLAHFSVSVKQKHLGSMINAGDVILLQNAKVVKYRDAVEAATMEISSVLVLVHHYKLIASKDISELVANCQVGITMKEKLKRVIAWVKQTESLLQNIPEAPCQGFERKRLKNWKSHEHQSSRNCISISVVSCLTDSCMVNFLACIGEIVVQHSMTCTEEDKQKLFISKRLFVVADSDVVDDLICIGCKLCGSPLISSCLTFENRVPLYCQKSSDHVHFSGAIYRPFLLPVLVKNKAAEILFGNISAEKVIECYKRNKKDGMRDRDLHHSNKSGTSHAKTSLTGDTANLNQQEKSSNLAKGAVERRKPDFYRIWLILLKSLLLQDKNAPFQFEITVNPEKDQLHGRFELVSFTMPCHSTDAS